MELTNIGPKLKRLRLEKGLTQKKLGELLNYSESAISYIESGARSFDEKDLPNLSLVFNVPITYFVDSHPANFRADASEKYKNANYDSIMNDFIKYAKKELRDKKD